MMDRDEALARISHLAWCAFQMGCGQRFNEEPDDQDLSSQANGWAAFIANPDLTPEANHENWMTLRLSEGWVYGPVKDKAARTHPDLVPYAKLPEIERLKDEMDCMSRRVAWRVVSELMQMTAGAA